MGCLRAVLLLGPGQVTVAEVKPPEVPKGWALVRSKLVGICGTDKAFYKGTYKMFKVPLIPGHEVFGVVEEGPEELLGKEVTSEINFPCWTCDYCRSGMYTHCPRRKTLGIDFDGGMAEYFAAPAEALHPFPGPPEKGIFVEPLAAVLRALSLRPPRPTDDVAVIGTGNVAWLTVQALRALYGVRADLIVRRGSSKAQAYRGLVKDVVPIDEAPESHYDVVFEVSGDPNALDLAIRLAKPMGTIHLKSTPGSPSSANMTVAVVKEVEVIGSRCGTFREFRKAIDLLLRGLVEPRLDSVFPLEDAREAFEESAKPGIFKVAVRI
ncbi:MAG: alcohol dehydrogenase catalytic domain-containing protein [Desulfurococcaceae archaeon]